MLNQKKILECTQKLHDSAKDGSVKIGGNLYEFKFDSARGHYEVTENGEFLHNYNTRQLKVAKVWLEEYFQN